MNQINVKLRIVGLYFNENVVVDDAPTTTVRTVLDEYIRLNPNIAVVGGLQYISSTNGFVNTLTYHFGGTFNFDGNNVLQSPPAGPPTASFPDGISLGRIPRLEGIYTLSEYMEDLFPDNKVGLVWQYYVVSKKGKVKSKTPVSRGFSGFGEPLPVVRGVQQVFAEGDTVIWRLVAIVREPNFVLA